MNLGNLSHRNQILLMIIIPVLILVLFYIFYFSNTFDLIINLKKENDSLKSEIDKANKLALKAEELKNQITELQKEREQLMNLVPKEPEINNLTRNFYNLAHKKGLNIDILLTKDELLHSSGEVYVLPIVLGIRGNYHSLLSFISELETFDRIITIDKFLILRGNISSDGNLIRGIDPSNLRITLILQTYYSIPEEEKKKLIEKDKKEEKDKK